MKYTTRLEEAIRFAAIAHDGQLRKESERLPYVSHVVAVAILVANHTDDEDVVIAALLHDVLEDTEVSEVELSEQFGERVCELVKTVSEPKRRNGEAIPWKERKDTYLAQLAKGSDAALLISACDKIHNMQSKHRMYEEVGEEFTKGFSARMDEYVWYHGEILKLLKMRMPDTEITDLYQELYKEEEKRFTTE